LVFLFHSFLTALETVQYIAYPPHTSQAKFPLTAKFHPAILASEKQIPIVYCTNQNTAGVPLFGSADCKVIKGSLLMRFPGFT
jgi:hypothetical protein